MKQYKQPLLHRKIVCLISLSVLLVGCGDNDFSDLERYFEEVRLRPKASIEQIPDVKVVQPFIFKPEDLRDPFKPIKPIEEPDSEAGTPRGNGIKPDTLRRKEELEAFPVETLKMIGTVKMKSSLWALVKSADKTVYRVREGNYMGQNYGKIIRVNPDKIELMEIVPDQPGTWREQQLSIMLTDELGG